MAESEAKPESVMEVLIPKGDVIPENELQSDDDLSKPMENWDGTDASYGVPIGMKIGFVVAVVAQIGSFGCFVAAAVAWSETSLACPLIQLSWASGVGALIGCVVLYRRFDVTVGVGYVIYSVVLGSIILIHFLHMLGCGKKQNRWTTSVIEEKCPLWISGSRVDLVLGMLANLSGAVQMQCIRNKHGWNVRKFFLLHYAENGPQV